MTADRSSVARLAAVGALLVVAACGGRPVAATATPSPEPTPAAQAPTPSPSPSPTPSPWSLPIPPVLPSASAAALWPRELVFVEFTTGRRFSLQADAMATGRGRFVFGIPGLGAYSGIAAAGLQASATEILLDWSGTATFIAHSDEPASASPGPLGPGKVGVQLRARLDPATRTGSVTLRHGATVLSLVASVPSLADLEGVATTFERAMLSGDAAALYGVMNSSITEEYTPAGFAQHWASEQARVGTLAALRRLSAGPSAPTLDDIGSWTAVIEYEAERVTPTGARGVARYDAYFVRERSGWKFFFSTEK